MLFLKILHQLKTVCYEAAIIIKALKVYTFSTTVHESFEGQNLFLFPIDAVLEKFASTEDGLLRNSEALLFYLRYSQLVILLFF
jgi:hypothetical protein